MVAEKKEIILETIIVEYLRNPLPIGSEQLRSRVLGNYSSSTIRKYFKELIDEGFLMQYHASGGRVPTQRALQGYWARHLQTPRPLQIESVERIEEGVRECGISAVMRLLPNNRLKEVVEVPGRYLILIFEKGELLLGHDPIVKSFLEEFVQMDILDLRKIVSRVGLHDLRLKIDELLLGEEHRLFVREALLEMAMKHAGWFEEFMASLMRRGQMDELLPGLYFDSVVPLGYMGFKQEVRVGEESGWLFCVGELVSNFGDFLYILEKRSSDGA